MHAKHEVINLKKFEKELYTGSLELLLRVNEYGDGNCKANILKKIEQLPVLSLSLKQIYESALIDLLIANGDPEILKVAYKKFPQQEQLFVAVCFGWKKKVSALITRGNDINTQIATGETPLYLAAKYGRLSIVKHLIEAGANVNYQSKLYDLIANDKADAVQARVEKGMDPNAFSPLCVATLKKHYKIMKLLLENSANVNQLSPIGKALEQNASASLERIKNSAIRYSQKNQDCNYSAMHIAAFNNDIRALELLLQYQADPNRTPVFTIDGVKYSASSPLHVAAQRGSVDAARFLIEKGASINQVGCDSLPFISTTGSKNVKNIGLMPMHYAAINGREKMIALLLDSGAKIDALGRKTLNIHNGYRAENTALGLALETSNTQNAAKILIMRGANLANWHDYMTNALLNNDLNIMALLLSRKDKQKCNLKPHFETATTRNMVDAVRLLLANGAKVTPAQISRAQDSGYDELYELLKNAQQEELEPFKPVASAHGFFSRLKRCLCIPSQPANDTIVRSGVSSHVVH